MSTTLVVWLYIHIPPATLIMPFILFIFSIYFIPSNIQADSQLASFRPKANKTDTLIMRVGHNSNNVIICFNLTCYKWLNMIMIWLNIKYDLTYNNITCYIPGQLTCHYIMLTQLILQERFRFYNRVNKRKSSLTLRLGSNQSVL